jgi:hypothetical protein
MCLHIGKYAKSLLKAIESGVVLDSWMKHELSIAGSMIDSVFHYLDYFNSGNHLAKGGGLKANDLAIGTKIKHKGTGVTVKVWNVNPTTGLMQCERDGVKFPQWRSAKDYELVKK